MNEVLIALGRSASDPDAVLDSIVESVRRLCRCEAAGIFIIEGDHLALASSVGFSREYLGYVGRTPIQTGPCIPPGTGDAARTDPADPGRSH